MTILLICTAKSLPVQAESESIERMWTFLNLYFIQLFPLVLLFFHFRSYLSRSWWFKSLRTILPTIWIQSWLRIWWISTHQSISRKILRTLLWRISVLLWLNGMRYFDRTQIRSDWGRTVRIADCVCVYDMVQKLIIIH